MRKFLVGLSAAFAVIAIATPAWAPHGCPGGCPDRHSASTAAAPAPPKLCRSTKNRHSHACPRYRRGHRSHR